MPLYGFGNITPMFGSQHTAVSVGGTTDETTLYSLTIPANTLGANGSLQVSALFSNTNSANNKTLRIKFGGTIFMSFIVTTTASNYSYRVISNRNATSSQVCHAQGANTPVGSSAAIPTTGSIDTTVDQTLLITGITTLETGFAATSCTRASGVVTVVKASHGLNTGEYVQVAGATPASFDADPVSITRVDANSFTYVNAGSNESTSSQPTIKRYSVITLESVCVEVSK